jgi:hypothetical protein
VRPLGSRQVMMPGLLEEIFDSMAVTLAAAYDNQGAPPR